MSRSVVTPASRQVLEDELLGLLLQGFSLNECIGLAHASYPTIRKVARTPEFLAKVKDKSEGIAEKLCEELAVGRLTFAKRLEEASEKALDEMMGMLDELDGQPRFKIAVCQDLMDRDVRASRKTQQRTEVTHDFISPAVLIHAAATAKELKEYQEKRLGNGNPGHPSDSGDGQGGGPVEGTPSEG